MKNHAMKKAVVLLLLSVLTPCIFAQSYQTYAESSAFNNASFNKSGSIFITACFNTFSWNRSAENMVREELKKNGIEAKVMTDYADATPYFDEDVENFPDLPLEAACDYYMLIFPGDTYTFTYGGGISQMDFSILVNSGFGSCQIDLHTEADTNDMLSLAATKGPALESMAQAFVKEYLKYVKDGPSFNFSTF